MVNLLASDRQSAGQVAPYDFRGATRDMLKLMVCSLQAHKFWDVPVEDVCGPGVPDLPGASPPGVHPGVAANLREIGLWWPLLPGANSQLTSVNFQPPAGFEVQLRDPVTLSWPWSPGLPMSQGLPFAMFFWDEEMTPKQA